MEQLKSEIIAEFLNLLQKADGRYQFNFDAVNQEDKYQCDILHKFELEELSQEEMLELDKQLIESLKERRIHKDETEELIDICEFAKENKKFINQLTQLLGKVRKVESYHAGRKYKPRIMKDGTGE